MTARIAMLLSLVWIAGCASTGPAPALSPAESCARRADSDPTLREDLGKAAGNLNWEWQNKGRIEQARRAAISRCLSGTTHRGGVEAPR